MKKLMFSTAAIVMALSFNAFAGTPEKADAKPVTKTESNTVSNQSIPCYLDEAGVYREKLPGGRCETKPDAFCTYMYEGDLTPETDQNPAHYVPDTNTAGETWEP